MRRNCMSSRRSWSLYLFIRRVTKEIVLIIEAYHLCSVRTVFCPTSCRGHYGGHQCGYRINRSNIFHIFCICQRPYTKRENNEAVHQLFIYFKRACDSVRKEVLYNTVIVFGTPQEEIVKANRNVSEWNL